LERRNKVKGKEERQNENEGSDEEGKDFHNAQNLS